MDALEEAQQIMATIQERVSEHEVIGGEALIQMLDRYTALADAQQLKRIADALEIIARKDNAR